MKLTTLLSIAALLLASPAKSHSAPAPAPFTGWQSSGSIYVLTTPEGADLQASAVVEGFPLLVRLRKDTFDFTKAQPHGEDVRFATGAGVALAYEIEEWDAARGEASVWVRVPKITGNARQELRVFWGKADAKSESNGAAVFNEANGFASVLHLDAELKDAVGSLTLKDAGSTDAAGVVGKARHFVAGKGINCGEHITNFPFGDMAFTSEAWFRGEKAPSAILWWGRYATRLNGKTGDGNEVVLSISSPPKLSWGSDGPGGASSDKPLNLGEWHHVAATYADGVSQLFVDGQLEGTRTHKAAMSVVKDIGMVVGGLRGSYEFAGDIDEVRVSRVARSADWVRLTFENQKPMQTLVGPVVQAGAAFSVSSAGGTVMEGKSATVTAQAGGALKVYWVLKRDGRESVVAVDRFSYTFDAGRVVGDAKAVLQFRAVYPGGVKTKDIAITVKEDIAEPVFALKAPAAWDGRASIEVVPVVSNLAAMQAKGAGDLKYKWSVSGGAVIKEIAADKLILKRSQFSGKITVSLALNNGGAEVTATAPITITEPAKDAWVQRIPAKDEKPVDNQFYARDDRNEGALFYNGTLEQPADTVFLRVYADGKLLKTESVKPGVDKSYALSAKLKPGLIKYKVEFGTKSGGRETVVQTVNNIVCGDAYIIEGQSNAVATGPNNDGDAAPTPLNDWIRSYGNQHEGTLHGGWGNAIRTHHWGKPGYGDHQIGAWGMVLANGLVEKYRIPICIINGAAGGTPIFQHQRNPENHFNSSGEFFKNPCKIYGSLLTRITAAKLTHGIRGVIWHQGENDSGTGAPTGDYNYKSYQHYFIEMAAAWKQDFPNIQHYYVFQVWPAPCNMGPKDDQIREAQRNLQRVFSNLQVMSTVGIAGPHAGRGECHFDLDGYARFAGFMSPLVEQDNYGLTVKEPVSAPDLKRVWFTSAAKDEVALEFGQPMKWTDAMKKDIYLDDAKGMIAAGSVVGNIITLKLTQPTTAKTIAYLSGHHWDGKPDSLIFGANGIAALTFCDVPLSK